MSCKLVFQTQGLFQGSLVIRVHNTGYTLANKRSLHRIEFNLCGIGNLLYTYYNLEHIVWLLL
ncbi:hypothetical protein PORCAN_455 [Porphyromonas crevioricanis JCM 13913]|nr:hypothetical protein PORCAN_455 [Porphyromonas crevioricanis JCM 13913]